MKAEKVYETFEMPNDKTLGWKTVLSLVFSLVAAILIVIVALYADLIDRVMTLLASMAFYYPVTSGFFVFGVVLYLIYKRAKR